MVHSPSDSCHIPGRHRDRAFQVLVGSAQCSDTFEKPSDELLVSHIHLAWSVRNAWSAWNAWSALQPVIGIEKHSEQDRTELGCRSSKTALKKLMSSEKPEALEQQCIHLQKMLILMTLSTLPF